MTVLAHEDQKLLYSFTLSPKEYAKNNTAAVCAFLFAFFSLEAVFIQRWIAHHPVSFYLVNGVFGVACIFSLILSHQHKKAAKDYSFTITDEWVTCDNPLKMMGPSYSIGIGHIVRLERLFDSDASLPGAYRIVHTRGAVLISEFPGHSGHDVFEKLLKIRTDLEVFDVSR